MTRVGSNRLSKLGTIEYGTQEVPLDEEEWQKLESLLMQAHYDHIIYGDANEQHSVGVARFINDVERVEVLDPLADDIREIVMSDKMRRFYSSFTGTETLCLRRCQANRLNAGDYIGIHKDQDSNPDYVATAVFHFGADYRGGDFITRDGDRVARYRPSPRTVLVNNCEIPHEVSTVEEGSRLTLACFLSDHFGDSPSPRQAFRVSQTHA